MPLLVGEFIQRHVQKTCQAACLRPACKEARHVGAFDRAGTGTDADGGHILDFYSRA